MIRRLCLYFAPPAYVAADFAVALVLATLLLVGSS